MPVAVEKKPIRIKAMEFAITKAKKIVEPHNDNRSPEIAEMLMTAGLDAAHAARGDQWCVSFVYWCYAQVAGNKNPMHRTASATSLFNWALGKDKVVDTPQPGDIFIGKSLHHAGIVINPRNAKGTMDTVEGNTYIGEGKTRQNDGVYIRHNKLPQNCYFVRL
jgi:hypothetical protein